MILLIQKIDFFFAKPTLNSLKMSLYQEKHIVQSFNDMYSDEKLAMRVKVWFMVFVAQKAPDLQALFRDSNVKSDMVKFLERHNITDISKVPPCKCTNCGNPVKDDVNKVLKRCGPCNRKVCDVRPIEKTFAWEDANKQRQKGKCFCCSVEISRDNFSAAHVTAVCYGGRGVARNLRPTCHSCNAAMMTTDLNVFKAELVAIGNWLRVDQHRSAMMEHWWQELAHIWLRPTSRR